MLRDTNDVWHEAAHAVVGVYLGLRCLRVVVTSEDRELRGYATFRNPATKRMAFGVMLAAGPEGDKLRGFHGHYGWSGDLNMLREYGFLPGEVRMLRDLAAAYLAGPCADAWASVAAALADRDLSGAEVRDLVIHGNAKALEE